MDKKDNSNHIVKIFAKILAIVLSVIFAIMAIEAFFFNVRFNPSTSTVHTESQVVKVEQPQQ